MRAITVGILTRLLAVAVTIMLFSHSIYIIDETYRVALRTAWKMKNGQLNYTNFLSPSEMMEIHYKKRKDYLSDPLRITDESDWRSVELQLENTLVKMFERTDKMKGWELKKIGSDAWHNVTHQLKRLHSESSGKPVLKAGSDMDQPADMSSVVVYNRLPKAGSTFLLDSIYALRKKLGYLVLRGTYHSYRYFRDNDRKGLGHFLEQASTRAKTMYVQHQYYVNFTEFHIDQPKYINMVRDPIEQFISSYFYRRTTVLYHKNPADLTTEEKMILSQSLEECIVERRLECVYYGYTVQKNKTIQLDFRKDWSPTFFHPNDYLLHFCGHDTECSSLGNPLALQRAKHNVENHFTVVGVLEHMKESAAVLEHKLPDFFTGLTDLVETQSAKNKNSVRKDTLSKKMREILRYRFADLYELYNFIKQKLFKQYEKIK